MFSFVCSGRCWGPEGQQFRRPKRVFNLLIAKSQEGETETCNSGSPLALRATRAVARSAVEGTSRKPAEVKKVRKLTHV